MSNTKIAKIDVTLVDAFGRIGREFANKIKKEYNLESLFVSNVLASQLIAGKLNGKKEFKFKIRKTSLNKGILELVD